MEESVHEQIAFGSDDFAENPEPRCPVVLLLDTSGSMAGEPIRQLNRGLVALRDELNADALAAKRVEIAAVTFGPVRVAHDFVGASAYVPPTLSAGGDTPMGGAILQGLDLLRQRKAVYEVNGIAFYRPWVFLMTDGAPTDRTDEAIAMLREGEASRSFSMFAVGIGGARMDVLAQLSPARPALRLDGLRFRDLFVWLSNSMRSISQSTPGTSVPLANPTTAGGWASISA
ncbi:MAG TPA: VWA domain-containing protein [Gemmatirosa sp.]